MKKGDIVFCQEFPFAEGDFGAKYFVVLNDPIPEHPFLCILTTSQKKDKYDKPGCYVTDGYFFIAPNAEWFPKPTWLRFNYVYEFPHQESLQKETSGIFKFKYALSLAKMQEVIKCIKMTYDITPRQISML